MKKIILTFTIIMLASYTYGQVLYGPKAGLTMSNLKVKGDQPSYNSEGMKPGLLIGFYIRKQFPSEFFIQGQLDYRTFLGGKLSESSSTNDIGGPNLYLPITFGSSLSYNIDWYLGGAFGLPLDIENHGFEDFMTNLGYEASIEELRIDLIIGLDFKFSNLIIDVGYYIALFPTYYSYEGIIGSQELYMNQILLSVGFDIGNN